MPSSVPRGVAAHLRVRPEEGDGADTGGLAQRSVWASRASGMAAHEVRLHRSGSKHFVHPVVGPLDLAFEAFAVSSDCRLTLTAYTAAPGSPSADGLALLASWAATPATSATPLGAAPDRS